VAIVHVFILFLFSPSIHAQESVDALVATENTSGFTTSPRIERHYPIYFISGKPDTKIQFSFKVGLLRSLDLYLGYTQVMFWELDKESWPFYDVNYNPEMFYIWKLNEGILKSIHLGIYEHRSNGEDEDRSRSWNRSYINFNTEFKAWNVDFASTAKVFHLYGVDAENRGVRNTLGFLELTLAARNIFKKALKEATAEIRLLPGGKFDLKDPQGHEEFNFRFKLPWHEFNPFIFLQVYNGLNETMLDYDTRRTAYRIGFEI
jgi:phospholipase A1